MRTEVLVVGAGPTGLVLALWLTRLGVKVRIVDRALEPGTTSRAMVVHARTLEFYDQLGIAQAAIEAGEKGVAINAHLNRKLIARIPFGDFGEGLSPYPFTLVLPQDVHERLLQHELAKAGIRVEQGAELLDFAESGEEIEARLKTSSGEERVEARYLCGCDGARSIVRERLGLGFPGGTYQQVFFVADAEVEGSMADDEVHFALSDNDIFAIFPLRHRRGSRLIGVVPPSVGKEVSDITFEDVAEQVYHDGGLRASKLNWFSTYHVHHRVAAAFRKDRVFLLGDAGHIHSPAGGQGMNTGIGDAANLAWKLAAVLRNRAAPALLDSYEAERIAIAHRIVATTDRIFSFQVSPSWSMRLARRLLVPLMPGLMRVGGVRRWAFKTISQIAFEYRASPISSGSVGVRAGERLPWVRYEDGIDNFAPLRSLDWQAQVYGEAGLPVRQACAQARLALRQFPYTNAVQDAGLEHDALYLIRPDGHVGLAAKQDADSLGAYLSRHRLTFDRLGEGEPDI